MGWELSSLVFTVLVMFAKIKEAVAATWILGAILSALVMLMGFWSLSTLAIFRDTCEKSFPQSYEYISMIVTCVKRG